MTIPVIIFNSNGGAIVNAFVESNYPIHGVYENNFDSYYSTKQNFPSYNIHMVPDFYSDIASETLLLDIGRLEHYMLVQSIPRDVCGFDCSNRIKQLNPLVSVLFVPSDIIKSKNNNWVYFFKANMKLYDSVLLHLDTAEYACAVSTKKTVIISIRTDRIGNFGTAVEAKKILDNVAKHIILSRSTQKLTPRTCLQQYSPELIAPGKDFLFLTPRGNYDQAIYSLDDTLPTLRNTCVRISPVRNYIPREMDNGINLSNCIYPTVDMVSILMGVVPGRISTPVFTATVKLLINTIPPSIIKIVAGGLFNVTVSLTERIQPERTNLFVSLANNDVFAQKSVENSIVETSSELECRLCPTSRIMRLLNASSHAVLKQFIGKNKEIRFKVSYTIGSDKHGDEIALNMSGKDIFLSHGWVVEIRERKTKIHAKDDIYWQSPLGTWFRTRKQLIKCLSKQKTH